MAQINQDNLYNLLQDMLNDQPEIETLDLNDQEKDVLGEILLPLT